MLGTLLAALRRTHKVAQPRLKAPSIRADLAHEIVAIGRVSHQKNYPLTLAAFEQAWELDKRYRLTIAGKGEGSRQLLSLLARSRAQNAITWRGPVAIEDMPAFLGSCGILLLTSRYEASPRIVREALKTGRLVVSTDVGDVADIVHGGSNGYVVESTAEALAHALMRASSMIESGTQTYSSDALDLIACEEQEVRTSHPRFRL
jgi:glycosyltransferase involved in cell wall biosynthesis